MTMGATRNLAPADPSPVPVAFLGHRRETLEFGAVLLFLAVLRLPALGGPINLSQDAAEYIDIARNVAAGRGLTLRIRGYFFNDGYGVPYPSQSLRSPLFPLLLGSLYKATGSERVFEWFNFSLFLANMILFALVIRPLFSTRIAILAVLLAGLTEPVFLTSIFPWAEQTAFFWLLLAMLLAGRQIELKWGAPGAFFEGAVCAMSSLSRPEYMLVGIMFLAWILWERRRAATVAAFLAGFALPVSLLCDYNLHVYGRTFLPGSYLFHSRDYAQYFSWAGSGRQDAWTFIKGNWFRLTYYIARNAVNYLAKLIGWKNLFLLAVPLPVVVFKAIRGKYDWRRQQLAIAGLSFLTAYCMVWAGMDRERYLLAVTPFLLPLCLTELDRWRTSAARPWIRRACVAAMAAGFALCLANVIHSDLSILRRQAPAERFYARENPAWSNPDMARLDDWIRANVGTDEVLCLENPFLVNYSTERPAVIIPAGIAPGSFPGFLAAYRVRYFVANRDYTKLSRQEIDRLEKAVRAAGATKVAECGTYRVYRLEGRAGSLSTFFPHSARSASRCPSGSKSRRAPGKVASVHPCSQNTLLYL